MNTILKRGQNTLIGGRVLEEAVMDEKGASIMLDVNGQKVKVICKNGDYGNYADNLMRFNPRVGSFITVYGRVGDSCFFGTTCRGNGKWGFKEKDGLTEANVLVGTIRAAAKQSSENRYHVSVPVTDRDGNTVWHNVTFVNHENVKAADNIRKFIQPGETRYGYVVCGKESEFGGSPSYFGNRFQILDRPKNQGGQEGSAEAAEMAGDNMVAENDMPAEDYVMADGYAEMQEPVQDESNYETAAQDVSQDMPETPSSGTASEDDDNIVITFGQLKNKTIGQIKGTEEGRVFKDFLVKSQIKFSDDRQKQVDAIMRAFA